MVFGCSGAHENLLKSPTRIVGEPIHAAFVWHPGVVYQHILILEGSSGDTSWEFNIANENRHLVR